MLMGAGRTFSQPTTVVVTIEELGNAEGRRNWLFDDPRIIQCEWRYW
jgi:hypothetical protein